MSSISLQNFASFRKRFQDAQAKSMDLSKYTTQTTKDILQAYAGAVGCPAEYLFLPLLTTCASFMGAQTKVKINDTWYEPAILWTLIVARKGEKKSAAIKPLIQAVEEIQQDELEIWQQQQDDSLEGTKKL